MKTKIIATLLFIISAGALYAQSDYSKSDNERGTSMMPIYKQGNELIKIVEEKDLEIVRMEYDIVTTKKKNSWRILVKDVKYSVIVFGDYRIKDIDVAVYRYVNKEWVKVTKDKKEDSFAIVSLSPDKTEEYKIEISVYEFKEGYTAAHYGLFVAR